MAGGGSDETMDTGTILVRTHHLADIINAKGFCTQSTRGVKSYEYPIAVHKSMGGVIAAVRTHYLTIIVNALGFSVSGTRDIESCEYPIAVHESMVANV